MLYLITYFLLIISFIVQESTADTEEMGTDSESTTSDPDDNDEHDNYYTKGNEFEQDLYYLEVILVSMYDTNNFFSWVLSVQDEINQNNF